MLNIILILVFFILYIISILFNLLDNFQYFDLILQVILGIISYIVGFNLLKKFKVKIKPIIKITLLFGISFMFSGVLELLEYVLDYMFSNNLQYKEQVDDTMIDIIVTAITFILCYFFNKGGKK